jgi:hypothetical protein
MTVNVLFTNRLLLAKSRVSRDDASEVKDAQAERARDYLGPDHPNDD